MIAARRTIDHLRKAKSPFEPFDECLHDAPTDASENRSDQKLTRWVAKAAEVLASRERILIDLIFRQGLPAQDVAVILRLSVGAVYTQKSRILAKLRNILEQSASL